MAWRDYYPYFPPSQTLPARGGIKAQSRRGAFGESWWARRWIAVLEGFNLGARLGRGRSYARRGQVLGVAIDKGSVEAKVQGSRPRPYEVRIKIKLLPATAWARLARKLSGEARFVAKLLASEMPADIEEAFRGARLSLFPERRQDLQTECSCPDWSNPCKHIAAVYYLLGEEFDRDPFLIFKLRGISREELVRLLGGSAGKTFALKGEEDETSRPSEPLAAAALEFWGGGGLPDDPFGAVQIPAVAASLPRRLGKFPFWRGEEPFLDALGPLYARASSCGLEVFLGQQGSSGTSGKERTPPSLSGSNQTDL